MAMGPKHQRATVRQIALLASLLIFGLAISGCEVGVAPDDVPYVERMVVYGVITAGEPADSIRFTRTLPLNVPYDPAAAELTDVVATIEAGGNSYPLRHIGHGFYNAEGLTVAAGQRYTLRATWKGLAVHASTTTPIPPVVDSLTMVKGEVFEHDFSTFAIWAYVRPVQGSAYSITYNLRDTVNDIHYTSHYDYVNDVWHWRDTTASGYLIAKTYDNFLSPGNDNVFKGSVTAVAWDEPYYDYYRTYYYGNDDDLFGSSQRTINWNIEGDGIGLFIGQSRKDVVWK
ncbi:MAG: hypothetical protein UZ07_CHB004001391 [Chlorobi bacterium OLB7]|nr:MAG: hypothetical protein UZ07_CHB004001391 [Chlorobi bacterium OLB7]